MAAISENYRQQTDYRALKKKALLWGGYVLSGLVMAVALAVIGFFLSGGFSEPPTPDKENSVLVTDTIIIEPEKKPIEVKVDTEIPRMDIDMDNPLEIETPPLNIQYTINPNLSVGVSVPAPPTVGIYGVHQLETQPRIIHASPPNYPRRARQLGREGVVRVRIVLDKEGKIVRYNLVPGDDVELFGDATLEAIKNWRFSPGKIGNRPVMCEVEVPVEFSLGR